MTYRQTASTQLITSSTLPPGVLVSRRVFTKRQAEPLSAQHLQQQKVKKKAFEEILCVFQKQSDMDQLDKRFTEEVLPQPCAQEPAAIMLQGLYRLCCHQIKWRTCFLLQRQQGFNKSSSNCFSIGRNTQGAEQSMWSTDTCLSRSLTTRQRQVDPTKEFSKTWTLSIG